MIDRIMERRKYGETKRLAQDRIMWRVAACYQNTTDEWQLKIVNDITCKVRLGREQEITQ